MDDLGEVPQWPQLSPVEGIIQGSCVLASSVALELAY